LAMWSVTPDEAWQEDSCNIVHSYPHLVRGQQLLNSSKSIGLPQGYPRILNALELWY